MARMAQTQHAAPPQIDARYCYTAYGLSIASSLAFPELIPAPASPQIPPDVVIHEGAVPTALADPLGQGVVYQAKADQFLLTMDHIGRYLVQNGNEICIARAADASESDVRLFLLGSCLGALLHQRGMLAMHASCVQTSRGAILFTGRSGIGKSTLLGALLERGYPMLADDVAGLTLNADGIPVVTPSFPQVKLWADALGKLERSTDGLRRVRPTVEKFALSVPSCFVGTPVPLAAVYILTSHNLPDIQLTPMGDIGKFRVFLHNTYRERFLDGLGLRTPHFALATAAAKVATVTAVKRPSAPFLLTELVDRLEADFQQAAHSNPGQEDSI